MATIDIYGVIGQDSWWGRSCNTTKAISDRLDKIPEGEEITVRINSLGGSVTEGLGIYNLLKARGESVTTVVVGCAASMAGVILCAGSTAIAPATSLIMIHSPSSIVWGTAEEMRAEADTLDVMRSAMVAAYMEKSGMSEEDTLALMAKDSWMTGAEAAEKGFCTVGEVEVVDAPDDDEEMDDDEYLMIFGSASSEKKILKFPDKFKPPAAKDRKRFEKLGWKFEPAAMGDRFVASAIAAPPAPKVSPTKTKPAKPTSQPDHKDKDKPMAETVTEIKAEVITPVATTPAVASAPVELPADVVAQLAELKTLKEEAIASKEREAKLQKSLTVTAQYAALKAKATALQSDLKLPPTKVASLFSGDRASAETLIASPQLDNHLFYLQEALNEAEASTPALPTQPHVREALDDQPAPVATSKPVAGESLESVSMEAKILAKAKELGLDPNTSSGYARAMTAVGYVGHVS